MFHLVDRLLATLWVLIDIVQTLRTDENINTGQEVYDMLPSPMYHMLKRLIQQRLK